MNLIGNKEDQKRIKAIKYIMLMMRTRMMRPVIWDVVAISLAVMICIIKTDSIVTCKATPLIFFLPGCYLTYSRIFFTAVTTQLIHLKLRIKRVAPLPKFTFNWNNPQQLFSLYNWNEGRKCTIYYVPIKHCSMQRQKWYFFFLLLCHSPLLFHWKQWFM